MIFFPYIANGARAFARRESDPGNFFLLALLLPRPPLGFYSGESSSFPALLF